MENKAVFEIFFIDYHRRSENVRVRAVVSNIGNSDGGCKVNCYVKNLATEKVFTASTLETASIESGKSETVNLEFNDIDIAEKNANFTLLKVGEYSVYLGETFEHAVEVYSFTVDSDKYL